MTSLPPNSIIGIVGGGQLGRMIGLAAARLGYRVHVFTDQAGSSAAQITDQATVAAYDDLEAMHQFAQKVDVVTIEFENLPVEGLRAIASDVSVCPSPDVLAVCQDRLKEKQFLQSLDVPTAPFAAVGTAAELKSAIETIGAPSVLKTRRMGYDGKGQVMIQAGDDLDTTWHALRGSESVLEGFVTFEREVSVITARTADGEKASYVPVENQHEHHILAKTIAPAPIPDSQAMAAIALAERIADGLDLVGLVAVEMFQTFDGDILVNELAPRPHNSGHWTMDACLVSQFEQVIRAITGLPLGAPERFADAEMDNLLGDAAEAWLDLIKQPNSRLHLYGKTPIRPGRKQGHITTLRLPAAPS
ncbi:MAG: 5-(carboxyamino)imidazole ribonucleotide synthase [Pseudomonadota bacterium]